ncbi:MAG: chromate transporter [Synergistaceae bacterium]|jgi:chromate transporter|nr:chromate transporter [Synergistaceae bacterium]
MTYLTLIYEFLKIGLFSIGGGLATLPFLYQLADKYTWFSRETLIDMIAISESTPGPIGLNMATYAGYAAGGIPGGIIATLSIIVPSFFILSIVVRILDGFKENRFVKAAFYGIRPSVTALIASAALGIIKITLLDIPSYRKTGVVQDILNYRQILLFAMIFLLMKKYKGHPIFYIVGAALAGIVLKF